MPIKQQLEQDLKAALLAGDKEKVTVLRGIKSAILNTEIAEGKREHGLDDTALIQLLQKEAKTRGESAEVYKQGGADERATKELAEKEIIEAYLPQQLSDDELNKLVDEAVTVTGASTIQDMGKVIGQVKAKAGGRADGGRIAAAVRARLG